MVIGLEVFREHFSGFEDRYTLIGGTATDIWMEEAGLAFRATKDLDIVLSMESGDVDFANRLKEFIGTGGYVTRQKDSGKHEFYRFLKPTTSGYPHMLELFSRTPDGIDFDDGQPITPVALDDNTRSLSAILLDDNYYQLIQSGKVLKEGVPVVDAPTLVLLKAKAFLDLATRKESGEPIDTRDIKKHRNDILRLAQVLDPATTLQLPDTVQRDMAAFLGRLANEDVPLKNLGIQSGNLKDITEVLEAAFGL